MEEEGRKTKQKEVGSKKKEEKTFRQQTSQMGKDNKEGYKERRKENRKQKRRRE
jgi:hypothetical protein